MDDARNNIPESVENKKIKKIVDILESKIIHKQINKVEPLYLPKNNVLIYSFEDKSKIAIRPSGTEPKIKIYFDFRFDVSENIEDMEQYYLKCKIEAEKFKNQFLKQLAIDG